ncbi:TIGR01459 family HAD-type hydrolase [Acetobacter fallax]|uniref:TIGR01459 family HAD-type hydrolase n=1 Tax=Acetobacter fallax TaxID=1737473 RepID=A0ABX0K9E2_9PROT|nr:TIGR01459 family HAD-type hydrolase [Acetobacter fallax]NHO31438.1 TIGR01459 family HAD-type hydrolase [Acetobacter fallax]NHO34978.1 TIGR01459 family HAD-type hydrolase [Acetobacter fallax]
MSGRRMEVLSGVSALADRYDGYVVDLWGTVHDGVAPYPGAVDCLKALRAAGKRVVLLSNAPRPAKVVQAQLAGMGVDGTLYDGLMTSGELTWRLLSSRDNKAVYKDWPWLEGLGKRVLHIGGEHDLALFEGLGLTLVDHPGDADFVLNTGPDERRGKTDLEPYLEPLAACVVRDLPMVCANPDLEVIRGGVRLICAGLLGKVYEQKDGVVHWIGKPYPAVYQPVLEMLGVPSERVIGVGDALATDIRGADAAGIAGLWVLGGIHQEKLGNDPVLAQEEADGAGLAPVATVPTFVW